MCVSFSLDTLRFSLFEPFSSRVKMVGSFPAPTQCIKKLGPGLENLYIQQALLTVLLIPAIPYLKVYNSSPLILARMKGHKSKQASPLDSGYRSKCGTLNMKCEIQAPLHFIAAVLVRLSITGEVHKLSV